ncbi:hypothetical protein KBD33_02220 [Candidatus Gracilibacteria bacterium]|nr:hypothetical protein [Candidatus Gracilibacteria bacterium]
MNSSFEKVKNGLSDICEGGKCIVIPMAIAEATFVGIIGKGSYELIQTISKYIGTLLR